MYYCADDPAIHKCPLNPYWVKCVICKGWANTNVCSHTLTVTNVILRQLPPEKRFASCDVVKLLQAVDANRVPGALQGGAKGPKNPNFLDKAPVNQKGQYKNSRNEQIAATLAMKGLSRKGKREAKQRALKIKAANDAAMLEEVPGG